jgi:protein-disulfide isomerase
VTLVEFADLQCPICAEYDRSVLPELVQRYVRTGKVKMNLEVIAIIGPQSRDAARAAAAAARQNRMWQFADAFYANQGPENGGYVTPQFIRSIAQKVPGLDVQRLVRDERSPAAEAIQREAVQLAARFGVDSTPTFELSRTGGKPTEVQLTQLSPDELAAAIDRLLAKR